jgi:hypothetical protein
MGVKVLNKIDSSFTAEFDSWIQNNTQRQVAYTDIAPALISRLLENYPYKNISLDFLYPNLVFN